MEKNIKNINIEILHETWKKLKIISIDRDVSLQHVVREILERYVSKKGKPEVLEE